MLHSHHIHSETSHQFSEIEEAKDKNTFNEINDDSIFQSDIILLNNTVHNVSDDNSVSRSMHSKTGNLDFNVMASEFEDNAGSSHSTSNMGNLKCGSFNVCGIKRRLHYPEFVSLIKEHDIFCLSETKIDKYDIITLEGYKFLSQCRKQKYLRKSGGTGVFIKDDMYPHVMHQSFVVPAPGAGE